MVYEMNEDGSNPADDGKLLYRTVVNLDCDCDYTQLKNCLRGLKKNNFKMSVDTASFGPDEETGKLKGNMTVNMYYLYGSEKPYEPLTIDGVSLGTDDILERERLLRQLHRMPQVRKIPQEQQVLQEKQVLQEQQVPQEQIPGGKKSRTV